MALNRGMQKAAKAVIDKLTTLSKPIDITKADDIINIASVSANNDVEIGKTMAKAFHKLDGCLEAFAFFDCDDTIFADPFHGVGEQVANLPIVIRAD